MDDKMVGYHYNILTRPPALQLIESSPLWSDTTICNGNHSSNIWTEATDKFLVLTFYNFPPEYFIDFSINIC